MEAAETSWYGFKWRTVIFFGMTMGELIRKDRSRRTYPCEQNKMLEASIQMSVFLESDNFLEMWVVDMSINPEQPFEYRFNNFAEILRKWCSWVGTKYFKIKILSILSWEFILVYPKEQDIPSFWGKIDSLSSWVSIQSIK